MAVRYIDFETLADAGEVARRYADHGPEGVLVDHACLLGHLGAVVTIGQRAYLKPHVAGKRVWPVLCGDFVMRHTEDGPEDQRCGYPIVPDGTGCPAHDLGPDHHKTCEHGLSLALCAGPMHYPADY